MSRRGLKPRQKPLAMATTDAQVQKNERANPTGLRDIRPRQRPIGPLTQKRLQTQTQTKQTPLAPSLAGASGETLNPVISYFVGSPVWFILFLSWSEPLDK